MVTKIEQSLADKFDLDPAAETNDLPIESTAETPQTEPEAPKEEPRTIEVKANEDLDEDFEIARKTMHNLLLKGQQTLENAIIIADGTEDPESYNAVSSLIGRLTSASNKLLELHQQKEKLIPSPAKMMGGETALPTGQTNITGPVFCGTTSELSKAIIEMRKLGKLD